MKVYILQRKLPHEGKGYSFIAAAQNIEAAKRKAQEYIPFGITLDWKSSGFRWNAQMEEWMGMPEGYRFAFWQIFETELEGFIPPQAEPLEFSPVPDVE